MQRHSQPLFKKKTTSLFRRRLCLETLEARLPLAANLVISEFMANNTSTLRDGDGNYSDWIEIFNAGGDAVDLSGWFLTDNQNDLEKWPFPRKNLAAGDHLVVFASSQLTNDYVDGAGNLHTNFSLASGGEYLALAQEDAVVHEFAPEFPQQFEDVSFGLGLDTALPLGPGSPLQYIVPTDDSFDPAWRRSGFDHPDLVTGETGGPIGYSLGDNGQSQTETIGAEILARENVDSANGSIFLLNNKPFTKVSRVIDWSIYSNNELRITPLILKLNGNLYEIVGVGKTQVSDGSGEQTFSFELQDGTDLVEAEDYFFGFKDGNNSVNNSGVAQWSNNTSDSVIWFGGGQSGNMVVGKQLFGLSTFPRSYSIEATAEEIIESEIKIDVESTMFGASTSLYVRYPFQVEDPDSVNSLTLQIRYDDGFVAYLNGQEVTRRNTPTEVTFDSLAPEDRPTEDNQQYESIDLSTFTNFLNAEENILAIHLLNDAIDSPDLLLDARLQLSVSGSLEARGYFETPTPGSVNQDSFAGFVADTTFSLDRGIYDSPQLVEITSATPGATIIYTLDGSEPSSRNGFRVDAEDENTPPVARVRASRTTTLRAMAIKTDFRPTNIDTQTYIFPADVVSQGALWTNITQDDLWGRQMIDALTAVPTISIVTSETIGLSEKAISLEMIFPDGSKGFQVDAGVEHFGGHSLNFPKKNMRISFKNIYGPSKLKFDLFEDGGVDEFDQILLRAGSHDTMFWRHPSGTTGTYIRNRLASDIQLEMGQPAPRGRFVHVYINGEYWGQHHLMERPNAAFMASNFGGDKEDYDALNAGSAIDGDTQAWNKLRSSTGDFETLSQYLDLENYADYMLLQQYGGNDWDWRASQNWAGARKREDGAGYVFFAWDSDVWMRSSPTANVVNLGGPGDLWAGVRQHPEFLRIYADRVQKHFFNGGALTPESMQAKIESLAGQIELSVIPESARWGRSASYTPDTWQGQIDFLKNQYVPNRTEVVIGQLRNAGLFPNFDAPVLTIDGTAQHGGRVDPGDMLGFSVTSRINIYYTDDGTDPVAMDGTIVGNRYTGEFPLNESTTIKVRAQSRGAWSGLVEASFTVEVPLRVTEIMFNPDGADDSEFIELVNTSEVSIPLAGIRFNGDDQGIEFTFAPTEPELNPGDHIVVVRDREAFAARHDTGGIRIAQGQYADAGKALSNGGETLVLEDPVGGVIQSFTFDDDWYKETDGDDFSLVIVDNDGDYDAADNWRSSALAGGSPGVEDGTPWAGDFNGDGNVNAADFRLLVGNYGTIGNAHRGRGDINGDGDTNLADLIGLQTNFGSTIAASPELSISSSQFETDTTVAIDLQESGETSLDTVIHSPNDRLSTQRDRTAKVRIRLSKAVVDRVFTDDASIRRDSLSKLRSVRGDRAIREIEKTI